MYEAAADPYCYPSSKVLRNRADITNQRDLNDFELAMVTQRFAEGLPNGRLSVRHYYAVHRHLFQDVYHWAGQVRIVRISKGASSFCYPDHIAAEMTKLFAWLKRNRFLQDLETEAFAKLGAYFLSELNAIHPFRDGNGRSQLAFMAILAVKAGHSLHVRKIKRKSFLAAMVASFNGNEEPLIFEISKLVS